LPLTLGTHTVHAKFSDTFGNWSSVVTDTITYDDSPPAVQPPSQVVMAGATVTDGKVLMHVPWSAQDPTSGIAHYDLGQRTDSGTWKDIPLDPAGASVVAGSDAVDRWLAVGHSYTFRARATDMATNVSGWAQGPKLTLRKFQELNSAIRYGGTWRRVSGTFWGGYAKKSMTAGASAAITFSGRAAAWVSRTGPDRGRAQVLVNGVVVATVDLYSPVVGPRTVVWAGNWTMTASRTVTVRNLATAGRPRIDLDAFVIAQ
jgi:hypothetical protein